MGCGISRPETDDEGGGEDLKINRRKSTSKDSENADSSVSDKESLEMSIHSKKSKTGSENTIKEEEEKNECKNEQERGDEIKISPGSPSFRIYCVFPRDPNDDNVVDDSQRNKYIADQNKEHKGRKQEAVGVKIRRRFNNVKKLLIPPNGPSSTPS
ncbi:unnamed protein product [Cochlearia groenlandica]